MPMDETTRRRLVRVWPVTVPAARHAYQAMWRSPERPQAMLRVDAMEADSSEASHLLLLELLGEFESPSLTRAKDGPGDVAFTVPGGTVVLFARSNAVVMVRNAERDVVTVTGFARALDEALVGTAPSGT